MSEILSEVRSILEESDYWTSSWQDSGNALIFEDDVVLGSVRIFDTGSSLLSDWEDLQDRFLKTFSTDLGRDHRKSWNVYSVFLVTEQCKADMETKLYALEEDFRGTRKLVRHGVVDRADIKQALLPLLPLQHLISVAETDSAEILRKRLSELSKELGALVDGESADSISKKLLGD